MEDYSEAFRMNIKFYREQKGWSQAELAIQANSSNGQIGNIEAGKALPSFELILRIADAFSIHPADLFLRDASKAQNRELYSKYHELLTNCEFLPEARQKIVKQLAQSLAEAEPDYKNQKK
ncbi:MAG: helix-turn-helix transcriptional regulator [Treponema sp.]|nr:helix-turn-helix transcriptional regulator [Treponema sp.]